MAEVSRGNRAVFIIENGLVSSAFVDAWLKAGNSIAAFVTADRKFPASSLSRKLDLYAAAIPALEAQVRRHRIPVIEADSYFSGQRAESLKSHDKADTLITLMTHRIIPARILELFGDRAVNVHPALLPHYKGPQPTLSLLVDGEADRYGGITIHQLDKGIDTGPVIARRRVPFTPHTHFHVWIYEIARAAADLAGNELQQYLNGDIEALPQVAASGNYRKSDRFEFVIEPRKTLRDVLALVDMPKGLTFRAIPGRPAGRRLSYGVYRPVKTVSHPTGAKPRITPFSLEMDISDARIRLWRRRKIAGILSTSAVPIAWHRITRRRQRGASV